MAGFARDVRTPGVVAVHPVASPAEAARLMRDHGTGAVVVAGGQDVVGVLTDRGIAVRAVAEGLDPRAVSAGAVCTSDPFVVGPYDPVFAAVAPMRAHAVRRLPVGVVGLGDLAEAQDPRSALAGISRAAADAGTTA